MKTFFGFFLFLMYLAGFSVAGYVVYLAGSYYVMPLVERPHSPLHNLWKPGGPLGHGLGILGGSMILLLFLYSARKRELFGLRWGRTTRWLAVHIFFGIMGPVFITLHTTLKLNGFISIGYFAMMAVMFSGIFGRYIYMQIPRNLDGTALTLEQIESKDRLITNVLVQEYHMPPQFMQMLQKFSGSHIGQRHRGVVAFVRLLGNDLVRPFRFRRIKKYLLRHNPDIPREALRKLVALARQKTVLMRRKILLDSMQRAFHYWHVIHKPFAYVMLILMFLHIAIAILFGYKWIF
ncbi:MAG: hypothetical protein D6814_15340 [Calditrichaeota bacterium]|nr:MAG: hypothetical protein D6814_15340 [Calditrichota bacterium]